MRTGLLRQILVLAAGVSLTGCAIHPVATDPEPLFAVPAVYSIASETSDLPAPWWTVFEDPVLNELVAAALQDNFGLAAGASRIDRARALVTQARAIRLPQVDFDGQAQRQWTQNVRGGGGEGWEGAFAAGALLGWEVDLWGRLRAVQGVQEQELAALIYDYEALRLSLSVLVTETYFQIVEQNLRYDLLLNQLALAQEFLDLLELRYLQGDASGVDVLQQRDRVAEIESQMPEVHARLGALENRLDVLLGQPADGVARVPEPRPLPLGTVAPGVGIPLELMVRRPDLNALQRSVVAQDYAVGAAIANRLPRVTLDGSLIYRDAAGGADVTATGLANLFQPLLDWGLRRAQVEAERARFEEALLAFSEGYLIAIEEVETTLWQEIQQRDLIEALENREEILDRTVEQARIRYSLGVTDYLPVLTALQNQQEVQRRVLEERLALVLLRVQLFRAIGAPTEPEPAETRAAASDPLPGV